MISRVLLVVLAVVSAGCAWTRRENRPVWTAFEDNLVPAEGAAFYAALPATVPLGLGAIVADTFVAHPLQVIDDAAVDAADLWRDIDFERAYYTQAGILPLRAIATPPWFLLSFAGRSLFDVDGEPAAEATAGSDRPDREGTERLLAWLHAIAGGGVAAFGSTAPGIAEADQGKVRAALDAALTGGSAMGRLRVFEACNRLPALGTLVDRVRGLRDPSAVVRYEALLGVPPTADVPADVISALRADPDPAVRELMTGAPR